MKNLVDVVYASGVAKEELDVSGIAPSILSKAKKLVLLPLGVDSQVHLRVPGQAHKESPEGAVKAALYGGVGFVLTMPNTNPVLDNPEALRMAQEQMAPIEKKYGVKVLWSAAMTQGQEGVAAVSQIEKLKEMGVVALTDDGRGVAKDSVMESVLQISQQFQLPVLQHAEVPGHGAALAEGPTQQKLGLTPYSAEAEWKMVERDLKLLEKYPKARYHVLHVSSQKTLELVKAAKQKGLPVSAEVTPHHLYFTSHQIPEKNTSFKMNPPLRGEADQKALQNGLASGLLDWVATDHAPHEVALKGEDFRKAAFGTTALEASLKVLVDLHLKGVLSLERLAEVFAYAPQRFWGLRESDLLKIGPNGHPSRGVLVDLEAEASPLGLSDLKGQAKNSCFLGAKLPGKILRVWTSAGLQAFDS